MCKTQYTNSISRQSNNVSACHCSLWKTLLSTLREGEKANNILYYYGSNFDIEDSLKGSQETQWSLDLTLRTTGSKGK